MRIPRGIIILIGIGAVALAGKAVASLRRGTPCDKLIASPSIAKLPERCWEHPKLEDFRKAREVLETDGQPDSAVGRALEVYRESRAMWPDDSVIKEDVAEGVEAAVDKNPTGSPVFYYLLDRWDAGEEQSVRSLLVKVARSTEQAIRMDADTHSAEDCSEAHQLWEWEQFETGHKLIDIYDRLMPLGNEGKQWKYFRAEKVRRILTCDRVRRMGYAAMGTFADEAFLDYRDSGHEREAESFARWVGMPDTTAARLRTVIRKQPENRM